MSEFIKKRLGNLDGRGMPLGPTGSRSNAPLTEADVAFAWGVVSRKSPSTAKLLAWCYMPSGDREASWLRDWLMVYGVNLDPGIDRKLLKRCVEGVLIELRWQFSKSIRGRLSAEQSDKLRKLEKGGQVKQRKAQSSFDRVAIMGWRGGKSYKNWIAVRHVYMRLLSHCYELEAKGIRTMQKILRP